MKSIFSKISSFFGSPVAEEATAPLIPQNTKITFNSSNKKIFDTFFTVITAGTVCAMIAIILYYVYAFSALYGGSSDFDWLLGIFSDFVVIMNFSLEESPYVVGDSSYPPIAIAILYPFALICKNVFARYNLSVLTADELTAEVILYPEFWIAILSFFAVCTFLTVALTAKLFGLTGRDRIKLAIIMMFSAPFVYAIMRGNTIYFALIFLLIFLILKDSKSAVLREISYIALALAGAIKLYPLFFGVFLLKKKKIFASFRVGVYFIIIFALSFFLFKNDFNNLTPFVDNLGGFMSNEIRLLENNNISLSAQLYKLLHIFVPGLSAESTVFNIFNIVLIVLAFAISTYAAIATRNDLSRYAICFAIIILIPSISYFYVIIFAVLPFLEYIKNYDSLSIKKRIFYFAAFMFLFTALFVIPKNFILHSFIIITVLIVEIVSVIRERTAIRTAKEKKLC